MEFDSCLIDIYYVIIKEGGPYMCLTLAQLSRSWRDHTYRFLITDVNNAIYWHDVFSLSKLPESWVNTVNPAYVYGNGSLSIVKFYANRCHIYNRIDACIGAGVNCNPEIMEFLNIQTDNDWSGILCGAYINGNVDLFWKALENGASNYSFIAEYLAHDNCLILIYELINYNSDSINTLIYGICKVDNLEVITQTLDYLYTNLPLHAPNSSDAAITLYSSRGQTDIANTLVNKYTIRNAEECYINNVMLQSTIGLQYLYDMGHPISFEVVKTIGSVGCIDAIEWLTGDSQDPELYHIIIKQVIKNQRIHILNYLLNLNVPGLLNDAMYIAGKHGVMFMADSMARRNPKSWSQCLYGACIGNNAQMITYVSKKGIKKSTIKRIIMAVIDRNYVHNLTDLQNAFHQAKIDVQIKCIDDRWKVKVKK